MSSLPSNFSPSATTTTTTSSMPSGSLAEKLNPNNDASGLEQSVTKVEALTLNDLQNQFKSFKAEMNAEKLKKDIIDESTIISKVIANEAGNDASKRVTETLAVFIGIFTFISVSFKVFEEAESVISALGLLMVFGGFLISFVLLLLMLRNDEKEENSAKKEESSQKQKVIFVERIRQILNFDIIGNNFLDFLTKKRTLSGNLFFLCCGIIGVGIVLVILGEKKTPKNSVCPYREDCTYEMKPDNHRK